MKHPCVYIMSNYKNGTLYIGVTSNLPRRIAQHKQKVVDGFTKKYDLNKLVYFEQHSTMENAIYKEKQMKKWNRQWKINKIIEQNPEWLDLHQNIVG
ncbi:GIY-YIG nuclease family protein [Thalassotalea psychrophila]|uniref:GIY-YIG nuclease family protein n=1 Tax=Thalassotalea psychrophila TaxID=3065647 RepID=A0ABY9TR48_9GAMM|nr:GIY-YIG nuclease family protein [Colwelliaceae bacterium SQ149]